MSALLGALFFGAMLLSAEFLNAVSTKDKMAPGETRVTCFTADGRKVVSTSTQFNIVVQQKPDIQVKAPDRYVLLYSIGMGTNCTIEQGHGDAPPQAAPQTIAPARIGA
jgi:hypothetical protein